MENRNFLIKAENILLRPFAAEDENDALEIFLSDEVKKTYMLPDFKSKDEATALFQRIMKMSLDKDRIVYAIARGRKVIGFINEVDKGEDFIELGYVINPAYKNNGYATMALSASIKELKRMGYKTVKAGYFEENIASRRVMEKCGMTQISFTEEIEYRGKIHRCIYFEI